MFTNILVAIDGSDISMLGLNRAITLAKQDSAKLHIIYVIDTRDTGNGPMDATGELIHERFLTEGKQALDAAKKLADEAGIDYEVHMETGSAGDTIVKTAEKQQCDLIVLGSLSKSKINRLILGSIASYVLNTAKTNIMIVRK